MKENIEVTHGGYVTEESYVYDCSFCEHTCDGENIHIIVDEEGQQVGSKQACACCTDDLENIIGDDESLSVR